MRDELYSNVFHLEKHNLHQHSKRSFDSSTNVPANQITQSIHSHDNHSLLLWSSFFVTLLAKKIPLFIQLFLPHEALHNYCNYADAHNYIQHMQIPLPLDKVTAPF